MSISAKRLNVTVVTLFFPQKRLECQSWNCMVWRTIQYAFQKTEKFLRSFWIAPNTKILFIFVTQYIELSSHYVKLREFHVTTRCKIQISKVSHLISIILTCVFPPLYTTKTLLEIYGTSPRLVLRSNFRWTVISDLVPI